MCIRCALVAAAEKLEPTDASLILNAIIDLGYRSEVMKKTAEALSDGNKTNMAAAMVLTIMEHGLAVTDGIAVMKRADVIYEFMSAKDEAAPNGAVAMVRSIIKEREKLARGRARAEPGGENLH